MFSARTGQARLGYRPSKKSIQRVVEKVHALTDRSGTWQETTTQRAVHFAHHFPENVVGSACTSSFTRLARRLLALRPAHSRRHLYVTGYTEGFSHFVTSMTAPVTSGWSVRRVGLAPTGKAPPSHGARK